VNKASQTIEKPKEVRGSGSRSNEMEISDPYGTRDRISAEHMIYRNRLAARFPRGQRLEDSEQRSAGQRVRSSICRTSDRDSFQALAKNRMIVNDQNFMG
jgi:hypothetical protein